MTAPAALPQRALKLMPPMAILLALVAGLCAGYLDVLITVLGSYLWNRDGYFRNARDFPWTVPVGHAVLLLVPGLILAVIGARPGGRISLRVGVWLFAALAIWCALLRAPLYGVCSLLFAVGLGRVLAARVGGSGLDRRRVRALSLPVVGILIVLAAVSSGWQAVREDRAVAGLPPAISGARNVVLVVWDTVRAYNVSSYGSYLDTTPNLSRWAQSGVQYNHALAPAPWTYPSHCCFMTGQWPHRTNSQWKFTLEGPDPTLAEYLTARGYQTAAFVANTNCCTYESGLARGFGHFEDYPLSLRALLTRTVPGKWLLTQVLTLGAYYDAGLADFHGKKWVMLQSRGAREINSDFLGWLSRRRSDRPFFAFLNYFDAHDPFIPPAGIAHRYGSRPRTRQDYQFLFDYVNLVKGQQRNRDLKMAFGCYNDCIAYLDEQLDRLLAQLKSQGLLENTTVIITSDHGEGFGDHGFFGHAYGVTLEELGVPLVILSPGAPSAKEVNAAVSLRDLPATVVDLLGLQSGSPFPGRSLAAHWGPRELSGLATKTASPVFSEQADWRLLDPTPPRGMGLGELFQMSLVANGQHYSRDGQGAERLFDVISDPIEANDLARRPEGEAKLAAFRWLLLDFLVENPASVQVENAYLKRYREELASAVNRQGPAVVRLVRAPP
jgi:arylsulfatase A-like enzyme